MQVKVKRATETLHQCHRASPTCLATEPCLLDHPTRQATIDQSQHATHHRWPTNERSALWTFYQIGTLRKRIIQRAGRLIRPNGVWTLSMAANDAVHDEMMQYLPT